MSDDKSMFAADAERPPGHAFAPTRDVACPKRFYELGADSIVEWHAPGARGPAREFCSLRALEQRLEIEPALVPALFIFHCGRCGSTLLGRLLEVDEGNRVCLEPNALLQFFELNGNRLDHPEVRRSFQTLVRAYGLARQAGEQRLVIKFSSPNVQHLDFVRACFPAVPFIYLLREPAEVVASNLRSMPLFLRAEERAALARTFGGVSRPVESYTPAEWCSWYLDQNLRWSWRQAAQFQQVIDYRECAARYLSVLNGLAAQPRLPTDPAVAHVLAQHSKRREQKFSAEADARLVTPEVLTTANAIAGESYRRWRDRVAGLSP